MADKDYQKSDFYALKAKKEGYPARSVYKLQELQNLYHIIPSKGQVLDVGSAPGSWTLFTSRNILKGKGLVVSVDLKDLELSPLPKNVTFFKGDAFSLEILDKIKGFGEYDCIISDAAPYTSGIKSVDSAKSAFLVESVLELATSLLKKDASLTIKFFQGSESQGLIKKAREMFKKVVVHKPKACRSSSFETYIVGLNLL